jgi:hemerythrin-like metal-binding protein
MSGMLVFNDRTMSTGVDSIDAQHQQLFDILNGLMIAMQTGRAKDQIGRILTEIEQYAGMHFDHEEACMWRFECPVAQQNMEAHAEFERTFERFAEDFDRDGPSPTMALRMQNELSDWISSHIFRTDVQLKRYVPEDERHTA